MDGLRKSSLRKRAVDDLHFIYFELKGRLG